MNFYLLVPPQYQQWQHVSYLFGEMIYILDVGCIYYEKPEHTTLILLTGLSLAMVIYNIEKHFNANKFDVNKPFNINHCAITSNNFVDAICHVWVLKMITKVNLFYLNELHDEKTLSNIATEYAKRRKKCAKNF